MSLPRTFAGARRGLLGRLLLNGLGQAALALAGALLVERLFAALLAGAPSPRLLADAGLLAAAVVTGALLRQRERVDAERLGQAFVGEVRDLLFRHLGRLPAREVAARDPGGLLLRFVGDLDAWRQWVSLGIARGLVTGLLLVGVLVALATLHWLLGLAVTALLAGAALTALGLGRALVVTVREARRRRARLATHVGEKLHSLAVMQLFGRDRREGRRLRRQGARLREAMVARATWIGWLRALAEALGGLATVVVLLLGARLAATGELAPAAVAAALGACGLLLPAARDLARVYEYRQGARVAREKVLAFLALPAPAPPAAPATLGRRRRQGRLELERVACSGLFDGLSAVAEAGSRIALCGPNGAGKSTLLALLARLQQPTAGRIRIDGVPLERLTRASLRRAVGLASADAPLLRGTVLANVRYGEREEDPAAMAEVRRLCDLDALAAALPRGLDTRVRDHGRTLSLGQRQRIVLARALLLRPRVLLLDEIGANFDPGNRTLIARLLAEYPGTVLFVTHDPALAAHADRTWHLADGRLATMAPEPVAAPTALAS